MRKGLLQEVRWITEIEKQLRKCKNVGATFSAVDLLPQVPSRRGIGNTAARAIYETKLQQSHAELNRQGVFVESSGHHVWRITCKMSALGDDFQVFIDELESAAKKPLQRNTTQPFPPSKIEVTGLAPLAHQAQIALMNDLGNSFLMAFAMITPVMMIIARSVLLGLLLMLPNVLPVTLVFGGMGLSGLPIDIASILTASVALGIAVDDTLHFVSWFCRGLGAGLSAIEAVKHSYHYCAIAMVETTMISCSAMVPFLFADFIPTQRFAVLMILMLSLALLGDLFLLPALLLLYFRRTKSTYQAVPTKSKISCNLRSVTTIRLSNIVFQPSIFEYASNVYVAGPNCSQNYVVQRHLRSKPDQSKKAKINRMAQDAIDTIGLERATR